ncbi:MAG: HAD family hydrolase [Gemmataceae bacterium]
MNQTKLILIAGFGNLGAKLLPLRWAFPHLRFFVVEKYWPSFQQMRAVFTQAGTIGELLKADIEGPFAHDNLKAFRGELERIPGAPKEMLAREYGSERLGDLFDKHVCYCGGPEYERGGKVERIPPLDYVVAREAHRELVRHLIDCEPPEVLLYLATRPEDYLWYLERYAAFARRAAIDKPLAKDEAGLVGLERFAASNPEVEIRPVDHYLFKLDLTHFNQTLEGRGGGLAPDSVSRLDVTIEEKDPALSRPYFLETGIIRDMMPHVDAMVSFLFRGEPDLEVEVGNVAPLVRNFEKYKDVRIQAVVDETIWAGGRPVPVGIRIGKAATANFKEVRLTWATGQRTHIDLMRKVEGQDVPFTDWAGALKYLMEDGDSASAIGKYFTFEQACRITRDVFVSSQQAEAKVEQGGSFRKDEDGKVAIPPAARQRVFAFNFDGVVINTVPAQQRAWMAWHEVLGLPPPDLASAAWYRPGHANRQMVAEAAGLARSDDDGLGFGVQDADALYRLFTHILCEEKLRDLRDNPLSPYHRGLLEYLRELRRRNQVLVLESTNDPLLVRQSLDLLFAADPEADEFLLGFDRYCVGRRNGLMTYCEIIDEFARDHEVVIFDDYLDVLLALAEERRHGSLVRSGRLRLVHMHTMGKNPACADGCRFGGYTDFGPMLAELG